MYTNAAELWTEAKERQVPLSEIILENEMQLTECSKEEVMRHLEKMYEIMQISAAKALQKPLFTVGSLITGIAKTQYDYAQTPDTLCGGFLNLLMARALSCSETNAAMGRICAAPTAGSCGIIPAVLITVAENRKSSKEAVFNALLVSAGLGAVIMRNATVAGAEGGCQVECGAAAAMAAAAAVDLAGGTAEAALHAAAFALMNIMGLICDPVAGLVQVPCAQRNASQAVNALLSADFALAGQRSIIPLDEVIDAMFRTGKMLPMQLRETAMGGIAATQTGRKINDEIFSKKE